ncbi:MAG: MotA/TolQ/ExbB proton channel family protein [Verrucomicrobiota bacterium]
MMPVIYLTTWTGSLQSALDQPIFPGKVLIWALLMLSIVSWVKILSKWLQLVRLKRSDTVFSERLRQARTTLELFEDGWRNDESARFLIYLAGARETAFQLLGSRNPVANMQNRVENAGLLPAGKARVLDRAFESGLRHALMKVTSGVGGLRFIGAAALFLGMIGSVWTLMSGFDQLEAGASLGPVIGAALGFVFISLVVATPAFLGRIAFAILIERLEFETVKFKEDINRLFERKFIDFGSSEMVAATPGETASPPEDPGIGEEEEFEEEAAVESPLEKPFPSHGRKKQYHSIRERLLRPPSDLDDADELRVNPIARQAGNAQAY